MSRKDDPVFNVKFVQAVERNQCLWNSTLPAYSKKEEIQKAWQDVANETKDTVRSCRERWRTIRSSFLRSLKMSRTSTGRGKRKYYLSKYLQFLIPYTKTRLKHHTPSSMMALRKYSSTSHLSGLADAPQTPSQTPLPTPPPMTCINHMPLPIVSSDDTKDSNSSDVAAIAEEDVVVSFVDPEIQHRQQQQHEQQQQFQDEEQHQQQMLLYTNHNNINNNNNNNNISNQNNNNNHLKINNNNNNNNTNSKNSNGFYNQNFQNATLALQQQLQQHIQQQHQPMRLPAIKCEPGTTSSPPLNYSQNSAVDKQQSACGNNNNNNSNNNNNNNNNNNSNYAPTVGENNNRRATISSSTATATVDLGEFADWIKNRNALSQQQQQQQQQLQRQYASTTATPPDADQSFLNSLHPYLKEMSGKQNRRFRQKVVALVDAILDNAD